MSPTAVTSPGAAASALARDGRLHSAPSTISDAGALPALPDRPRNPPRADRQPTAFKRETSIFQQDRKTRLTNAQTRLEAILAAESKLPDRFLDDQRTPTESLLICLNLCNIECSANEAHRSLSFITALVALATGVHNRNDLSESTRALFENDHDIHKAEASKLLQRINAEFPAMASIPIGTIGLDRSTAGADPDPRIPALLTLLGKMHGAALNVGILGLENREAAPGKQTTHLVRQGPVLRGEKPTEDNGYLAYDKENGRFLPLRERAVLTNPRLAQNLRYKKKSFTGKLSCLGADLRAPFSARTDAFQLSDPALYEKAVDKATGKPKIMGRDSHENEYIKEWLKRTDPDYKLKKQARLDPTRFQKLRSALPFTLDLPTHNPYLEYKTLQLSDMLNDIENKPGRQQRKLIKKAIYRNYVLATEPAALNPLPPTPVALAGPEQVKNVLGDFAALLQPGGDPSRSPLADSRLKGIRKLFSAAQVSMVNGFKTGSKAEIRAAHDLFREGLHKLNLDADGDDNADLTLPLGSLNTSDAGWTELRSKVVRLEQSLADLAASRPPPAHERTPEMAAVLRKCGFLDWHVNKFSAAIEPIVLQRQTAREELQRFLQLDSERLGESTQQLAALSEENMITRTKKIIETRSSVLNDTKKQVELTKGQIADLEHLKSLQSGADAQSPMPMPASLGFFLDHMLASMSNATTDDEIDAEIARLKEQLAQEEAQAEEVENFATTNAGKEARAEMQALKLENLAPAWTALNSIWSECDAFKKRTASPDNHPALLETAGRTLRGPLLEVFRHVHAQGR